MIEQLFGVSASPPAVPTTNTAYKHGIQNIARARVLTVLPPLPLPQASAIACHELLLE